MKETINYYNNERPEIAAYVRQDIKKILDIGCGQGTFLKLIKRITGAETWGVEVVKDVAEQAKKDVDNILIGKIDEVLSLLPNGYFDCITFNDVLEHIIEPTEILQLIKPKLANNGVVIASIPNVRYFHNLYGLLIKKDWEYIDSGILDSSHLRFFTKKSIIRMFENAGYKIIKLEGLNSLNKWKFLFFNLLTFGIFNDSQYLRFACIAY